MKINMIRLIMKKHPLKGAIMMSKKSLLLSLFLMTLCCCSSLVNAKEFKLKHQHTLTADGPEEGLDSYAQIWNVLAPKSIESPDLYSSNHTDTKHIIEANDDVVGNHFVFLSHLDDDTDRDKGKSDRQRNEIKVHDRSNPELMGFKNETMQYRWKFKIEDDFEFSKSFTHFFQVKAKNVSKKNNANGGDSYPLITLTVVDRGDEGNEFQLRHNAGFDENGGKTDTAKLIRKNLSLISGQWVEILAQIKYSEKGSIHFQIRSVETGELIVDFKKDKLDMWRGEGKQDFMRPKWGIYRSLKDKKSLRSDEEIARFADFSISKGKLK